MSRVFFYTLGCKVNQAESKQLADQFAALGYSVVTEAPADVIVINTCSVTQAAERKARNMIRRLKHESPNALVYVIGCYAAVAAESLENEIPEIHRIIPQAQKLDVATWDVPRATGAGVNGRYYVREFLKVQDGCDQYCAYCIIPYARGSSVDVSISEAVSRANTLISYGAKELILTGINVGKHTQLPELIRAINGLPLKRLRISSIEPQFITREFLEAVIDCPKVMPHLHIPLQSGVDSVLIRMKRRYTTQDFYRVLDLVRAAISGVAITTDVIVGFPGETDDEFAQTLAFVEKCQFTDIHVFAYSVRPGTAAADLAKAQSVPPQVIQQRVDTLEKLRQELKHSALEKVLGTQQQVLIDTVKKDICYGYTPQYQQVRLNKGVVGDIVSITPQRIVEEVLIS